MWASLQGLYQTGARVGPISAKHCKKKESRPALTVSFETVSSLAVQSRKAARLGGHPPTMAGRASRGGNSSILSLILFLAVLKWRYIIIIMMMIMIYTFYVSRILVEADVFNSLIGDQRRTSRFAASLWEDAGTLL